MVFNPLVARGSPFKAPAAPSVTAPEPTQEAIAAAVPAAATPTASTPEAGAVSPLSEGHVLPPSTPVDVVAETVLESQQAEAVNVDIPPPVEALPQVGPCYVLVLCASRFCKIVTFWKVHARCVLSCVFCSDKEDLHKQHA